MTEASRSITITYAQLEAENVCADQLALFEKRFGDSVTVTRDDVGDKTQGFDIGWLAYALLPPTILDEYDHQCALLLDEYERQCAQILLYAARDVMPRAEYNLQRELLGADCERQSAILFFDLYLMQEEIG